MTPRKSSAGTSAKVTMYRPSAKAPKGPTALTKGTTKVVIVKDGGRGGKSLSRSAKTGRFTSSTYRAFTSSVVPPVQPTPLAPATPTPAPAGHPDPLVRARAARDLADLDYRRAVQADPATQTEAARRLGTSQANISKLRGRSERASAGRARTRCACATPPGRSPTSSWWTSSPGGTTPPGTTARTGSPPIWRRHPVALMTSWTPCTTSSSLATSTQLWPRP